MSTPAQKPNNTPAKADSSLATKEAEDKKPWTTKFTEMVDRNFKAASNQTVELTPQQLRYVQHLGVAIENHLSAQEVKRQQQCGYSGDFGEKARNQPAFDWANVNLDKLKVDAFMVVELEADAMLPNFVFPIARLNGRTNKYDVGLQLGYEGKLHAHRKFALVPPIDVRCQLVFEDDVFDIVSNDAGGQAVVYKATRHFRPAAELPIGGFFELKYSNPMLNRVVVVDEYEFKKAMDAAQSDAFWGGMIQKTQWTGSGQNRRKENVGEPEFDPKVRRDMMLKTVILRAAKAIKIDPSKISANMVLALESPDIIDAIEAVSEEILESGNQQQLPAPTQAAEPAKERTLEEELADV